MEIESIKVYHSAIREKELTQNEALVLCFLNQIGLDKNIPSSREISKILCISTNSVSNIVRNLISKKYIEKSFDYTDVEVFNILSKGTEHKNGCKICGYTKSFLDEHHYPVRAKDGGQETISLCANCHREFHQLADFNTKIRFTYKAKRLFV